MPLPRFVDYGLRFLAPISLTLAIYYHYQSVQERGPTYVVSSARTRIVDVSVPAPPQLQVLYKGKDLRTDVSAAGVYFWNDGKLPIKTEDVLDPLKVEIEPGSEIIDARVLKVSRAVTNFTKGQISETAKNELPISFRILERNDGAQLQIIYTGKPDAQIRLTGTIVGAGPPRVTAVDPESEKPRHRRPSLLVISLGAIALIVTLMLTPPLVIRATELIMTTLPFGKQLPTQRVMYLIGRAFLLMLLSGICGFATADYFYSSRNTGPIPPSIQLDQ